IERKRVAPDRVKTSGPLSPETGWPPFGRKRLAPDGRKRVAYYRAVTDKSTGAAARGTRRGLPSDDLRGDPHARRSGAHALREEVATAVSRRGRVRRRSGRRSVHLSALSEDPVEGVADDKRA